MSTVIALTYIGPKERKEKPAKMYFMVSNIVAWRRPRNQTGSFITTLEPDDSGGWLVAESPEQIAQMIACPLAVVDEVPKE
jgi:hypothetical protein